VGLLIKFKPSQQRYSRSHNELVVDKLQYYIDYMSQGEYNLVDAYGAVLPLLISLEDSCRI
jgi:hypothetical protein